MTHRKSILALAVVAALGLSGCGGSSGGGSNDDSSDNGSDDGAKGIQGDVTDLTGRGDWGSLVLSGYGEVNAANSDNQIQTEAVPDGVTRWYGGTDNSDSSGTVKYAVVAETGFAFRQDEEVQGITVEGSGSGTTTSHIQILNSDDDGIEWFGGAANADHMVIQAATDDSLDQDLGFQGSVDTALIVQGPDHGNRGMETDNNGDDLGATPKSKPVMTNITILGHRGNESDQSAGALHREGYGGQVYRSVYMDNTSSVSAGAEGTAEFQEGCLDIDSELDEDLKYGDVLFNCTAGSLSDDTDDGASGGSYQEDFSNDDSVYGVEENADVTVNNQTMAINADSSSTSSDYNGTFQSGNGNEIETNDWFGAVDPDAPEADDDPNNDGPFWDGWVYRNEDLSTNLPGNVENFHPLQAEVEDGTITPADTSSDEECNANVGDGNITGLEYGGTTDVFGTDFPVCVISDGDLDGDYTLTNDHIYVLSETVQVGNGDTEEASDPDSVDNYTLTIEKGAQVFGDDDAASSLVITRGSKIDAVGTAEQPIIFGGVTYND